MSALPSRAPAGGWRAACAWLARLAGNVAGFAVCYIVLVEALWALGVRYVAPLVPRPPDAVFYHAGEDFNRAQDFAWTQLLGMCVPSLLFALALLGVALWRRRLWYALGPLLGLLLGDMRDYSDTWNMHCGGALRPAPWHAAFVAQGLCLAFAAWRPSPCHWYKETPLLTSTLRKVRRHLPAPRRGTTALALLLALAVMVLAGCEITAGHHVGDTISNAEVRITLTAVAVVPANASFQPVAGDELVRAHVRYTNQGRTVLSFNEVQFAVQNGGAASDCGRIQGIGCGVPLDGTYFSYGRQGLAGYLLQPGATVESDILFEVGKGAHDARLVYQPDGIEDIANFWWLLGL
ncbi:MAG TPA: DUF4352 domain-containing protein [Ktedonobacterales bacterium]|jgi:hypothetical protein